MPKRARTGQVSEYIPSPFRLTSTQVRCQSNEPVRLAYAKTWLKTAKIAKDKMVVSLALLIVSIARRIERKHNVPGLTSNPKEQANLSFFMRNVCLGTNAGLDTVSHQSSSRRKRVKKHSIHDRTWPNQDWFAQQGLCHSNDSLHTSTKLVMVHF
jgi:hypothetical protein